MSIPIEERLPVLKEYWREMHDGMAPAFMLVLFREGCLPDIMHINCWRTEDDYNFNPDTATDDDWIKYALRLRDAYRVHPRIPLEETVSDAQ